MVSAADENDNDEFGHDARSDRGCSPPPQLPKAPQPSSDAGIKLPSQAPDESSSLPDEQAMDIFELTPPAALKLLTAAVESLVLSGHSQSHRHEVPLTPPLSHRNTPEHHRSLHSSSSAADEKDNSVPHEKSSNEKDPVPDSPNSHHHEDVPGPHKTPIGSPAIHPVDSHESEEAPHAIDIAASAERAMEDQRARLARKFYSKVAPPIPLAEYLQRLHKYCPMSTAVYLAAGFYLLRLAHGKDCLHSPFFKNHNDDDSPPSRAPSPFPLDPDPNSPSSSPDSSDEDDEPFTLPITHRMAHRLLLASLRIATKALEDRISPHARFAKVGGVSEKELSRLEVNFAFLVSFKLVVREEVLASVARKLRRKVREDEEALLAGADADALVDSSSSSDDD